MPYINTRTNVEITKEQELRIKSKLGQAVALLGKPESYLMVSMEDHCRLYFGGDGTSPIAFVEVRLYGEVSANAYDQMTAAVTKIITEELSIPGDHIYVQYEEVPHWGFAGSNF